MFSENSPAASASFSEDTHQLLRWYDFQLLVCAIHGWLVRTPAPEVREMSETIALHVLVSNLNDKLHAQRLPA